ncbi:MAG TPA: alpha/beta hydrolase [Acidimicrobiales bacterium]
MAERIEYDEFGLFHENAEEHGIAFGGPPVVRRTFVEVDPGRRISALVWADDDPQLVLLHGGSQNAHTWDTVALALGRPLVAIDLPGHGHSDGPGDHPEGQLNTDGNAVDVAKAVRELAPNAAAVIGMSLGGLTTLSLARYAPDVVRKAVLVDVLPGLKGDRAKHIGDFTNGPPSFPSLEDLLERTSKFNPNRSLSSLRRGILHNAEQQEDGSWVWRWARHRSGTASRPERPADGPIYTELWEAAESLSVPLLLARGMRPDSVLRDDDEAELRRRVPSARIEHFDEAGHSIQGDSPVELAALIEEFVFSS